jgi:hypothetical protein
MNNKVKQSKPNATPEFYRASGDAICPACGKTYREHPMSTEHLAYDDQPYLYLLCGSNLVKL